MLTELREISEQDIVKIREALVRDKCTQFLKSFSIHLPFGTKDAYVKEIMAADLEKLANRIRICGFQMETKIYLSWSRN